MFQSVFLSAYHLLVDQTDCAGQSSSMVESGTALAAVRRFSAARQKDRVRHLTMHVMCIYNNIYIYIYHILILFDFYHQSKTLNNTNETIHIHSSLTVGCQHVTVSIQHWLIDLNVRLCGQTNCLHVVHRQIAIITFVDVSPTFFQEWCILGWICTCTNLINCVSHKQFWQTFSHMTS